MLAALAGLLLAIQSPVPQARAPLAVVIRTDEIPPASVHDIEDIERDLARQIALDDLKLEPVEARVAAPNEGRDLDDCTINDAEKVIDVDALVTPNLRHQWNSQGGHYGELRLQVIDCDTKTILPSSDDTIGRPYENVDRLSPKAFAQAFTDLEGFVIRNFRQR